MQSFNTSLTFVFVTCSALIGLVMLQLRPEALRAAGRIYVDDEVEGPGVPDTPAVPVH